MRLRYAGIILKSKNISFPFAKPHGFLAFYGLFLKKVTGYHAQPMKNQPQQIPQEPQHDAHVQEHWRHVHEREAALLARHTEILSVQSFVRLSLFHGHMQIDLNGNKPTADEDRQNIIDIMKRKADDPKLEIRESDYSIRNVRE